ncbi:MAG: CinA family protein [archaeon]|nr:CinA family protein [archaeon]
MLSDSNLANELDALGKQVITTYTNLNLTFGIAESMTGGLISHIITNQEGSSRVYGGTSVAYSAQAKHLLLGIPMDYIVKEGTVSKKMIEAMVKAGDGKYPLDVVLATTGVAGKSIEGLPRGTVFIGTNYLGTIKIKKLMLEGTREEIKMKATKEALLMLMEAVEK